MATTSATNTQFEFSTLKQSDSPSKFTHPKKGFQLPNIFSKSKPSQPEADSPEKKGLVQGNNESDSVLSPIDKLNLDRKGNE